VCSQRNRFFKGETLNVLEPGRVPYEIVVKDVRSFIYRTERDFDARYVTRRFDLDKLATLDFAVSHWDGIRGPYHVVLRF